MRRDSRGRHSSWLLAVVAWLLLAGCATAPLPSGAGSASGASPHEGKAEAPGSTAAAAPARVARSIGVVPAQYAPEVGIVAPSHAAASAAAKGAALGTAQGALTGMQFLVAGPADVHRGRFGDADARLGSAAAARVALRRGALGVRNGPALRPAHLVGRGSHSGRPRLRTRRARRHHPHRRDRARAPRVLLLERPAALHVRRRAAGDALERCEPAGVPVRRADGRRALPRPGVGRRVARTDLRPDVAFPLRVSRLHPGAELPLVPHALNLGCVSPARAASAGTAAACR